MDVQRRLLLGLGALGMTSCTHAGALQVDPDREPDAEIPLWRDAPPGGIPAGLQEIIQERTNPFHLRDRAALNVTRPQLSLFRADRPNGAAALIIPGGGYRLVVIDKEGYEFARWLSARGVHAYVLRYRFPHQGWAAGRYAPLQDAHRAMRVIRFGAHREGIAPERIFVIGFSAGGHLAGSLAASPDLDLTPATDDADRLSACPNLVALLYPVVTMRAPFAHPGSRQNLLGSTPREDELAVLSLDEADLSQFPPAFLLHAQDDQAVPVENTLMLHAALRRAGKTAALHLYETGGHGFGLRGLEGSPLCAWPGQVWAWAESHGLFPPQSERMPA
jgi:acetyl esterase/lipase